MSAENPRRCCSAAYPDLQVVLRETQTWALIEELTRGALDVIMLALPANDVEIESIRLFDDPFLLAVPSTDNRSERDRVSVDDIDMQRLLLLEEGHCLRDQALAFCSSSRRDVSLGATSLATVMQMGANGLPASRCCRAWRSMWNCATSG